MSNEIVPTEPEEPKRKRTFSEEMEVAGNQLIDRIQDVIKQGNVRRVIIRNSDGKSLIEVPLTIGAVAGGAVVLAAPLLAALGALAALVTRVKIEIVREIDDEEDEEDEDE